ncbi:class I SAM-dependent methyltransferase [Patescibacteria group bacterium]|nr:class I SAM-dependent methyltransferase [Patescibacteria group bacterium]
MEGFLNPNKILNNLGLQKDMVAVDFGCGSGGWVIPLAKRLEEGKVYAVDILEEPLSALQSRAKLEKLSNIETIRANVERGMSLVANSVDLVLMTNLLFQIEDKKAVFSEAKRILKKGGEILVVDWLPKVPLGPKKGRVSPDSVKKMAKDVKLKLKKEFTAGACHYSLVFTKN